MSLDVDLQDVLDKVLRTAVDQMQNEFQEFRAIQLQTTEKLSEVLSGIQLLMDSKKLQKSSESPKSTSQKMLEPVAGMVDANRSNSGMKFLDPKMVSKSAHGQPPHNVAIAMDMSLPGKASSFTPDVARSPSFTTDVARSRSATHRIPTLEEMEKQMLRCSPGLPSTSKARDADARNAGASADREQLAKDFQPVVVQPPHPHAPQAPLPSSPHPPPPPDGPSELLESQARSLSLQPRVESNPSITSRRGSAFGHLSRSSVSRIIMTKTSGPGTVSNIFLEKIGVSLWLNWSKLMIFIIILMSLCEVLLTSMLFVSGWNHHGELKTTASLLTFSALAIYLLRLMKRSLHSEDLNRAIELLDDFVRDCGQGLDWLSVAKKQRIRFVAFWAMVVISFVAFQTLELCLEIPEVAAQSGPTGPGTLPVLLLLRGTILMVNSLLFAICSLVVMKCADFLSNVLLGLAKTLDCWCADIMDRRDFMSGIETWKLLQALLKCAGREVTPTFTALSLMGYAGILIALASFFSLLLDINYIEESWSGLLHESGLIPFLYLFLLSVILFAKGASLSGRCLQIPAFVNQLGDGADSHRQYLVQFISDSAAGFIIHGVTLTRTDLLRQLQILIAILSGLAGVLMRRHNF